MRWLAIYLPYLPMESLAPEAGQWPLAIMSRQGARQCVLQANSAAVAAGVSSGMTGAAARALCTDLRLRARNKLGEQAALEGAAAWAGHFTSQVSLDPPWGLLLELGGSLRLFGGVDALLSEVRRSLCDLGYTARVCLAPTPAAAMLLAKSSRQQLVRERLLLSEALAPVPLSWLPFVQPSEMEGLRAAGLRTLGDLMKLSSAALGRRLGATFTDYLERLFGHSPDPRPLFRQPKQFCRRLELPAEVCSRSALRFAFRRLILELTGFLSVQQAATQCLEWLLVDAQGSETRFRLGLLEPSRDADHLQEMMLERLERVTLKAPVREVGLLVAQTQVVPNSTRSLLQDQNASGRVSHLLLERLRTRLGDDVVCSVSLVPDHRPEYAWCRCAPEHALRQGAAPQVHGANRAPRPLWLLPEPKPLAVHCGWPWRGARLQLGSERERLETGWWDGRSVSRDYFLALGADGERLWVYRELGEGDHWFLHGFF